MSQLLEMAADFEQAAQLLRKIAGETPAAIDGPTEPRPRLDLGLPPPTKVVKRKGRPAKRLEISGRGRTSVALIEHQPANGKRIPGLVEQVLAALRRDGQPHQVKDLAAELGREPAYVSQVCCKLMAAGDVAMVSRGVYRALSA
ncbi:MAG: hypothetical protein AB7O62_00165 [Pirellulales bacterium]